MSISDLAEFAGILSAHAWQIVESRERVPLQHLATLRTLSEKRRDAWLFRLRATDEHGHLWAALKSPEDRTSDVLIREILVSELLTRVHAGLLLGRSLGSGSILLAREAARFVRDHQEVRKAALSAMLKMADQEDPEVHRLDRLRRLTERWTDILLSPLIGRCQIEGWMFDPHRGRDYAEQYRGEQVLGRKKILLAGLQVAFPREMSCVPAHRGLHAAVLKSILGTLPTDAFSGDGPILPFAPRGPCGSKLAMFCE